MVVSFHGLMSSQHNSNAVSLDTLYVKSRCDRIQKLIEAGGICNRLQATLLAVEFPWLSLKDTFIHAKELFIGVPQAWRQRELMKHSWHAVRSVSGLTFAVVSIAPGILAPEVALKGAELLKLRNNWETVARKPWITKALDAVQSPQATKALKLSVGLAAIGGLTYLGLSAYSRSGAAPKNPVIPAPCVTPVPSPSMTPKSSLVSTPTPRTTYRSPWLGDSAMQSGLPSGPSNLGTMSIVAGISFLGACLASCISSKKSVVEEEKPVVEEEKPEIDYFSLYGGEVKKDEKDDANPIKTENREDKTALDSQETTTSTGYQSDYKTTRHQMTVDWVNGEPREGLNKVTASDGSVYALNLESHSSVGVGLYEPALKDVTIKLTVDGAEEHCSIHPALGQNQYKFSSWDYPVGTGSLVQTEVLQVYKDYTGSYFIIRDNVRVPVIKESGGFWKIATPQ